MNESNDRIIELRRRHISANTNLILSKNAQDIYQSAKADAFLNPTTFFEIQRLRNTIESDFRNRESRLLRGRTRYLSKRRFIAFSPCTILLGKFILSKANLRTDELTN